jgi:thymidylate synthase
MNSIPVVRYSPREARTIDTQYKDLLRRVLTEGNRNYPPQGVSAIEMTGMQLRYNLANGIPLITERSYKGAWKASAGEIQAFLNGATTCDELHAFGCHFWDDPWGTAESCARVGLEPGNLGKIYGHVWRHFESNGVVVDQIDRLIRRLKEKPFVRRHLVTSWNPAEVETEELGNTMPCVPCHGTFQILRYDGNIIDMHLMQRSCDLPIGAPSNIFQYSILLMMIAQCVGCTARNLVVTATHAHIYENQVPWVEEIIERESFAFPEFELDPSVTDIFAFRPEHVRLVEGTYQCGAPIKGIPTLL